jgi:formate hydrogenlyase subunit 3/multisubunit Na+/H+ antiporter MnhD subunit
VLNHHVFNNAPVYNGTVYTWAVVAGIHMEIGFLVDNLTALMISVVTFVSLMVHIYYHTIIGKDSDQNPKTNQKQPNQSNFGLSKDPNTFSKFFPARRLGSG